MKKVQENAVYQKRVSCKLNEIIEVGKDCLAPEVGGKTFSMRLFSLSANKRQIYPSTNTSTLPLHIWHLQKLKFLHSERYLRINLEFFNGALHCCLSGQHEVQ
jgi:hypothetical protein